MKILRIGTGIRTTIAATIGLTFGPSSIAVLSFGVFVRPIEMEFGWSRLQVSLAATVVSYMIMLVSPLQGWLTDRFGARRVILFSIPGFAVGLLAFYFLPPSLPIYYLLWAALPLLALGLWPLSYLKAVGSWFDRRLGLALGIANAGVGLGSAITPLILAAVIANYGWRAAFVTMASIVLVLTWPIAYWLLREAAPAPAGAIAAAHTVTPMAQGLSFRTSVAHPAFTLLLVAFFLLGLSTTALITQQTPMLIDAGWTPQNAANVQATFGIALMAGRLGIGYLIDRLFAPRVMAAVAVGGAMGCALYAAVPASPLAYLSAGLVGLVVGAEFDVLAYLIKRYFGPIAFGKLYGAIFSAFQLACGIGIIGLTMSRSHFGSYAVGFYAFAGILCLCALVLTRLGPFTVAGAARRG